MPFFLGNAHHWGSGFNWHGSFFWPWFMIPIALWSICATGVALWHAAKRNEPGWFIFFLFVHTAGILELLYLLFIVNIFSTVEKPKTPPKNQKKRRK